LNLHRLYYFLFLLLFSCKKEGESFQVPEPVESDFYAGVDLSYVNEMEDCGGEYFNAQYESQDVYEIFKASGANLVRLRLWHSPSWTDYSDLEDVKKSIERAKALDMEVLLDFHYSDDWADPQSQQVPEAWLAQVGDNEQLGALMYDYTFETLLDLAEEDLLPDMVQVGNEINAEILQPQDEAQWPINWSRNAYLINKGLEAVRAVSTELGHDIEIMLHIAQPENAIWWFEQATENGITNYDWIGLSYYPKWSEYSMDQVGPALRSLMATYNKKLMIVETAYPFTMEDIDAAGNIMGNDALISGYPATQQGQLDYLLDLKSIVKNAGGQGLVYWEPAWISTGCSTRWGQGSHWDNATLFNQENKVNPGMSFLEKKK
jgi:arabinogalactan endo-1,4-beta-galactosidase